MNTTPDGSDRFEAEVAERLRVRGRADGRELASLATFAENLPRRDRPWASRRLRFAVLAPLLVGVLVTAGLLGQSGPGATTSDTPERSPIIASASPAISASATPSPTITAAATPGPSMASSPTYGLPDASAYATDPRVLPCGGLEARGTRVLTAFSFEHASDYRRRLPSLGYTPALERTDSVLVLVYDGPSPLDLVLEGSPRSHTPSLGTYDICVGGSNWHKRFVNVSIDWATLQGQHSVASTFAAPRVLVRLPAGYANNGTNLVWDQSRGVLWYAYVGCGDDATLYQLDPVSGKARQWAIPSNTFGNCQPPALGLDSSGAIWVMESSRLVRFSPADQSQQVVIVAADPTTPSRTTDSRSYPTAIAFDGTSAVVARINTPSLTVVGPDMALETVEILPAAAGGSALAVANGKVFALAGGTLWVMNRNGALLTSSAVTAVGLSVRNDGQIVLWTTATSGRLVSSDGSTGESVVLARPIPSYVQWCTTDWSGRVWYVDESGGSETLYQAG
jgi:sugar lactone lactonase YvrE